MLAALVGGWSTFIRIFSLPWDTTSTFHVAVNFVRSNSFALYFRVMHLVEIFWRKYSNFTASTAMTMELN